MRKFLSSHKKSIALALAVLLVVGGVGGYFGAKAVLKHRIGGWRSDGIAAAKAGDHAKASDLLLKYIQRRPEDPEALRVYIDSREQAELPNGQHFAQAIAALKMLLSQEPDALDDRRHLLTLYVKLEQRPEALDLANGILAKVPTDAGTLMVKTRVLTKLGRYHDAIAAAEAWATATPDSVEPLIDRVELRGKLNHPADAVIAEAATLRAAHPGDARYELLNGIACAQGADPEAGRWLKAAAAHDDLPLDLAKVVVAQFDTLGMGEDALALLRRMAARGAGGDMRHALGRRLWEQGQWAAAAEALNDVDPSAAASPNTLLALKAISLANAGDKPKADACRQALRDRTQASARAWTLVLSRVIDADVPDDRQIVAECASALTADPDDVYLDFYGGDASARLGELDAAIASWRRVTTGNASWSMPALRLVEALLQKGQPEQAAFVAQAAAKRNPTQAAAVVTLARAWSAGIERGGIGNADELLRLVNDVQKQLPGEDNTLLIGVKLVCQKGQLDDAKKTVLAALDRQPPPSQPLLIALAEISRQNKLGTEKQVLDRCEKLHGVTYEYAYAAAINAAAAGDAKAGLVVFDRLSATPADPAKTAEWKLARARYLDASGHPDARAVWIALGDAAPGDLSVQQSAAAARSVSGEWEFQERTIDRLKKLTGETSLAWRIARARLDVEAARNDSDSEHGALLLTELVTQYPQVVEIRVLLSRALYQLKRIDPAIEHLTVASKLDPTSVPIALQLAGLLQSHGDYERVNQELERVMPQLKTAGDRRRAAQILAGAGSGKRAMAVLESKAAGATTDAADAEQDELMLALLYVREGNHDKARTLLRDLAGRAKTFAAVQYAACYFAATSQKADADASLKRLDTMELDPGLRELTRGICHTRLGDFAAADKDLSKAVELAPANAAAWRELLACRVLAGRADDVAAVAGRAAAAVKADAGLARVAAEAGLLQSSAKVPALRAIVLDVIAKPDDAEAAVETLKLADDLARAGDREAYAARLQQRIDRSPAYLPARLLLVDCYAAMGRGRDAFAAAKLAMVARPTDAAPVAAAVRLCVALNRWADVREQAAVWIKRDPAAAPAVDLAVAQADIGQKQYPAAVVRLKPYVDAVGNDADKAADAVTLYAIAALNTPQAADAQTMMLGLAGRGAFWRERALQTAMAVEDGRAAIAWLDRLGPTIPADDLRSRTILAEVYEQTGRRAGDEASVKRGVALMNECVGLAPASGGLLTAAGAQADRCGDPAAAEVLYRRALAAEPGNWVAQNNLATLMTGRGVELPEAVRLATMATRTNPTEPAVYDTLAAAQAKVEGPAAAAETVRRAVKLSPDDPQWYLAVVRYQADAGDTAGAGKTIAMIEARRLDGDAMSVAQKQQLADLRKRLRTAVN